MVKDYLGNEIVPGSVVCYAVGGSSPYFEHGVVIGIADESTLTRGRARTKMRIARLEKETWRWDRTTQTNVATNEWIIKKVYVESPFRMLVINNAIPENPENESIEQLVRIKAMFDNGEQI